MIVIIMSWFAWTIFDHMYVSLGYMLQDYKHKFNGNLE